MHGKVEEKQVMQLIEMSTGRPIMIEVHDEVGGVDPAEATGADRLKHIAKVGSPTTVLVHRQQTVAPIGVLDQTTGDIHVQSEGFLAKDMFTGVQGRLNDCRPGLRGRGHVDDFHVLAPKQFMVVGGDRGFGKELLLAFSGLFEPSVTERDDSKSGPPVSGQVKGGDRPAANEPN